MPKGSELRATRSDSKRSRSWSAAGSLGEEGFESGTKAFYRKKGERAIGLLAGPLIIKRAGWGARQNQGEIYAAVEGFRARVFPSTAAGINFRRYQVRSVRGTERL